VPSVPFLPIRQPRRDDPAHITAVGEHDMENQAVRLSDRPHARLSIVLPIVRPLNRIALENQGGNVETDPTLLSVPLALRRVPVEAHRQTLRY